MILAFDILVVIYYLGSMVDPAMTENIHHLILFGLLTLIHSKKED